MPDERKNYWKEMGLNPGPLSQLATTQTSRPRADYPNGGQGRVDPQLQLRHQEHRKGGLDKTVTAFLAEKYNFKPSPHGSPHGCPALARAGTISRLIHLKP